ncbi:MAG: fimbrial biosis protein [Gammaproteobacteria bacterium]|nr:fimbrial biosis protein [Gammaproteobacteria bacterium]
MLKGGLQRIAGFTLLELVVTMSIFAILVALGVPSMRLWIVNTRVRSVADSMQNGLRMAQAESLRRSRQTVFYLTNSTTPQVTLTANVNGTYWAVNTIPLIGSVAEATDFIGSGEVSAINSGVTVGNATDTAVCFNSVGRLTANAATGIAGAVCNLPNPPVGSPPVSMFSITAPGADHPLNVRVALGGQVHLCDPNKSLSTEPDGCP